jgi:hypothetical protein
MVLRQNLIHHTALEYRGKKKAMILLLWEKKFQYKNSKLFSDVCFDLLLLWQLPNLDIAFKQIKIVKMPKNNLTCCFFVHTTYTHKVQMCWALLFTFVYNHVQV